MLRWIRRPLSPLLSINGWPHRRLPLEPLLRHLSWYRHHPALYRHRWHLPVPLLRHRRLLPRHRRPLLILRWHRLLHLHQPRSLLLNDALLKLYLVNLAIFPEIVYEILPKIRTSWLVENIDQKLLIILHKLGLLFLILEISMWKLAIILRFALTDTEEKFAWVVLHVMAIPTCSALATLVSQKLFTNFFAWNWVQKTGLLRRWWCVWIVLIFA